MTNTINLATHDNQELIKQKVDNVNTNLNAKVTALTSEIDDVSTQVSNVNTAVSNVNASVGNVNTTVGQVKTAVDGVNTAVGNVSSQVTSVTNSLNDTHTAVNGVSTKVDTANIYLSTLTNTINTNLGVPSSALSSDVSANAHSKLNFLVSKAQGSSGLPIEYFNYHGNFVTPYTRIYYYNDDGDLDSRNIYTNNTETIVNIVGSGFARVYTALNSIYGSVEQITLKLIIDGQTYTRRLDNMYSTYNNSAFTHFYKNLSYTENYRTTINELDYLLGRALLIPFNNQFNLSISTTYGGADIGSTTGTHRDYALVPINAEVLYNP